MAYFLAESRQSCLAFLQPGLAVPAGQTSECSFLVLFYVSLLKLDLFLQLTSR